MEQITPQDILRWVQENKHDQAAIDMVSYMIFPYTSKYKASVANNPQGGDIKVRY